MKTRVSIIEDDAPLRAIFVEWLRQADDIEVAGEFDSAEAALKGVAAHRPDVILTDINLPGLNGIECIRRLKPQLVQTQFVILTVYEDTDKIFDALANGANGYLLKQTTREELLAAVREVVAGGSPMTSNIARKVVQSFQRRPASEPDTGLSPRETEILDLLARGYLYKEIAVKLGIAEPTVNSFIRRIYEKLHVHSRSQAVAKYLGQRSSTSPSV